MKKTSQVHTTVIVTTYNHPDALQLVLLALAKQECAGFEVIVADDGSGAETRRLIEAIARQAPYSLRHVWQPDQGFRAAMIRNKAATHAKGDYLIFLDGDSVPRTSFVRRHVALAESGYFVTGNRILLSKEFTERAVSRGLPIYAWSHWQWCKARWHRWCNRFLPLLPLPWMHWRTFNATSWKGAKTCNLGIKRADFLAVNGFDERYQGWGYEDSDLVIRLIRCGVLRKDGRYSVPVLHLWHTEHDRGAEQANYQRLRALLTSDQWQAELGVNQYQR